MTAKTRLPEILQHHQAVLVTDWLRRQQEMLGHRAGASVTTARPRSDFSRRSGRPAARGT